MEFASVLLKVLQTHVNNDIYNKYCLIHNNLRLQNFQNALFKIYHTENSNSLIEIIVGQKPTVHAVGARKGEMNLTIRASVSRNETLFCSSLCL